MEKVLIIDTETANGFAHPLCYDVGGVVVDDTGYIYHRFHFAALEIIGNPHIMDTAYYANKMPLYWKAVAAGEIIPLPFAEILRKLTAIIDLYDIHEIAAYNMNFDNRALSATCEYLFDNPNWLNRDCKLSCIWSAACSSLLNTQKYIKFCVKHGYFSDAGNPKTSAEIAFRYITGNKDFEEEHTGGKDAEIEAAIYTACKRRKVKTNWTPRANPWRDVAKLLNE